MRKALAILLVLIILSASGIIAAHAVVNEQRDQVVISENAIYGDKAAAYGLTVTNNSSWDNRLHWNTTYTIDEENSCNTDFRFTQQREYERSVHYTPEIATNNAPRRKKRLFFHIFLKSSFFC